MYTFFDIKWCCWMDPVSSNNSTYRTWLWERKGSLNRIRDTQHHLLWSNNVMVKGMDSCWGEGCKNGIAIKSTKIYLTKDSSKVSLCYRLLILLFKITDLFFLDCFHFSKVCYIKVLKSMSIIRKIGQQNNVVSICKLNDLYSIVPVTDSRTPS